MTTTAHPLIFVVLVFTFVATGVAWYLWSRNAARTLRHFAESKGLVHYVEDIDGLEARVNECVALDEPKLNRSFSGVTDIIPLGRGALFRAVELLDLMPYGRSEYVNQSRVAAWFPCRNAAEGIFSVSPAMEVHQRYPEEPSRTGAVRELLESARVPAPPCTLSLAFMRGHAVACLEPAVAGTVTTSHVEYLEQLADTLAR